METFFPDDSPLRYWLNKASISHIACSPSWPPVIAAIGYAPCVRAWAPTSRDEPEFKPVPQLLEVDGERFVACAVKGDLLVAADASSSGRISIWDTTTWTRQQTLTADAPVTCLDAGRAYIAAGTAAGYVRVWKRQSAADPTAAFSQYFSPDLQLDSLPVYCVRLGQLRPGAGAGAAGAAGGAGAGAAGGGSSGGGGGEGEAVMVVHTRGNGRVTAWRLSDAKIVGMLGRNPGGAAAATADPAAASEWLLSANVQHACLGRDNVLVTCSWLPGRDPLLQAINPFHRFACDVPGTAPHLTGVGKPLCFDYDGFMIAMGCEDGMVWVWGLIPPGPPAASAGGSISSTSGPQQAPPPPPPEASHWRGYHAGAVGAVALLSGPHRGGQVASAGADGCVKLWSPRGALLAVCLLGWQPTALAANELALVVGGAEGQVQILVLVAEDQAAAGAAASRPSEEDRRVARTPGASGGVVVPYDCWFDARPPKTHSGGAGAAAGIAGRVSEHRDAFRAFVPPRRQVTMADLAAVQQSLSGSGSGSGSGPGSTEAAAAGAAADGAGGGAGPSSGGGAAGGAGAEGGGSGHRASSFNMQAALKGAHRTATDQAAAQAAAAEEEAKRAQLRAMGEAPGVARSREAVQLESATAALGGRKCANPSCLQREKLLALVQQQQQGGAGPAGFKRCGACKSVFYCSAHCQSTHWRDGHKKECPLLAEAWRKQQQQQQQQDGQQQEQVPEQPNKLQENGAPPDPSRHAAVAEPSSASAASSSPAAAASGTAPEQRAPGVPGDVAGDVNGADPSRAATSGPTVLVAAAEPRTRPDPGPAAPSASGSSMEAGLEADRRAAAVVGPGPGPSSRPGCGGCDAAAGSAGAMEVAAAGDGSVRSGPGIPAAGAAGADRPEEVAEAAANGGMGGTGGPVGAAGVADASVRILRPCAGGGGGAGASSGGVQVARKDGCGEAGATRGGAAPAAAATAGQTDGLGLLGADCLEELD